MAVKGGKNEASPQGEVTIVFMNPDQESFCTKDHCNQMAISIYNSVSLLKDILVIGLIDRNWSWGQEGCIMGPYPLVPLSIFM
ncbi:unnamed protein product [Sphenostylis stenocarpa]|uniref:Uncharacterized protein n=1 Tax=Sphenostylis stenocarpa TaxID=92480 RepID=A0AA86T8B9_9FABA|nr:unnamed protein product [Sphenostylis stenocarpa]